MTIKRRELLGALAASAAGTLVAAPAVAQSSPEIRWRLTTSWPKSLDNFHGGCEFFAKRIAEITDGKFQIQVFAAGEIVPGLNVLDAVQTGIVELGHTAMYYYFGKDPSLAFGTAVPFALNARHMESWLRHGGGNELLQEVFNDYNAFGIPMGNTGTQMGGWFRKEVNTVADLRGVKFRIGGFAGKVIAKLGVIPQQLAGGEIYPALEKGTIDAVEWVGPYDDEKLGFYKVAKYYYYPSWWEGSGSVHTLVNLEKWNALPKHYQAAILAAARDAGHLITSKYDAANPAALRRLVANGAVLKPFSKAIMDASWKAAGEVYAETGATNPRFKRIHDSMIAFRNESYLWWQVSDYAYDTYQLQMRGRS
jgi:TRAP-type mannitol/chloroaromatic compound transport system substrate-binding protein